MTDSSRRMFLRGAAGFTLSIPMLTSLLPRKAKGQEGPRPVRYLQWITNHGQYAERFWPSVAPKREVSPGVKAMPLRDIEGPLSDVLGPAFDPIRRKINLVRGLDLLVDNYFHNACAPTCASWPRADDHIPYFSHSIDAVLETSPRVYGSTSPLPALRLTPGVNSGYKWGSFSWTTRNGAAFKLPAHETTRTAFDVVFGGGTKGFPSSDPVAARRLRLTDQVLEDYHAVVDGTRIGSSDRRLLSSYMDLLTDLQTRMEAEPPDCEPVEQLSESDFDILHDNATDIALAALLCGQTRVVAYHCYQGSSSSYDEETFHAWAHNDPDQHVAMQRYRYGQFARLVTRMDALEDGDGSLLDHSIVYCGNELSTSSHGVGHLQNMPVITAGGARGRLVQGQYIDFGGRLMNNLLVSFFDLMGLEPADYEREGVVGFGDYEGARIEAYADHLTDSERRAPLPYLVMRSSTA